MHTQLDRREFVQDRVFWARKVGLIMANACVERRLEVAGC